MPGINVEKVARLARLRIQPEDEPYFEEKFNQILDYVSLIGEVPIDSDLKEKDESLQVIFRPDKPIQSNVTAESFSFTVEEGFFKVPKVIE